jgi:hypothetical protein
VSEKMSPRIKVVLFFAGFLLFCAVSASVFFFLYVPYVAVPAAKYNDAVSLIYEGRYEEAMKAFKKMGNYRDSDRMIEFCKNALLEEEYDAAVLLYESGEYTDAISAFFRLGDFRDSKERAAEIRKLPMTVVISTQRLDLFHSESASVSASILPYTAENTAITWSSEDEMVATVDEDGLVAAVRPGITTIMATAHNGKAAACVVEVYDFTTVYVSTADEFKKAVKHYRTIVFSSGSYIFPSNIKIQNIRNLTLKGEGEVSFLTRNLKQDVITFVDCPDLTLQNITFGHVNPYDEYQCEGGVLSLESTSDIIIEQCKFFGSGSIGIETSNVDNLYVTDTQIYDCSLSALSIRDSVNIHFSRLSVHSNETYGDLLSFYRCEDITFSDSVFYDNQCDWTMISINYTEVRFVRCQIYNNILEKYAINDDAKDSFSKAYFHECTIEDNVGDTFSDDPNAVYNDCVIENNRPR